MFSFFKRFFGNAQQRTLGRYSKIIEQINAHEKALQPLSDDQVRHKTVEFKSRLNQGEHLDNLLPEAFAVVKNVCRRLKGSEVHVSGYNQKWDMVPYDVQILGAIALAKGSISEMQTGEGKTLTSSMPIYLHALSGKPVHLVTVNDYLANRDCQWMGSIFRWLGLTTGALTNDIPVHERKEIYQRDIVYGTASEFGFDYLRDNSTVTSKEDQVQRGHFYALVDEIDSILIDEARTPLIISGPAPVSKQMYDTLKSNVDELVRKQKDFCQKLASDAKKSLEKHLIQDSRDKRFDEKDKEAMRKLWLTSKGTPRNKILKKLREDPDFRAAIDKWDLYYYAEQNKEERQEALADLYIVVDEKANEYELTDKGIAAWQEAHGNRTSDDFVMLDLGEEYMKIDANPTLNEDGKLEKKLQIQEEDSIRKERAHNLRQMLRAYLLMEKDVDYIVQDNKVVIIDEHTGRPQPGRRFSDGLHQAIEAKEGTAIQKETQTYATITLQNYFRMYERLAGMTGTAITEAQEFKEIYKLEVLQIPSYVPCKRIDVNDEMYMTEREKYAALLKAIREIHEKGRPILIGTESVEVSEKLSRILKLSGLEHTVLNAKNHAKEAEIIAMAGQKGVITVATNMAGRGTDIKLGSGVSDLGGLHVIGTTRHQSRRIDRQLRGRCARMGDPGSSQFYISFEDSLMRLFSSPSLNGFLQRFRPPEGEPISASILNKSIETAQKRIEQRNYMIRKHTLEYDDVMNKQRQVIYSFRNEVLQTADSYKIATDLLEDLTYYTCQTFYEENRNAHDLKQWLVEHFPIHFEDAFLIEHFNQPDLLGELLSQKIIAAFRDKIDHENAKISQNKAQNELQAISFTHEAIQGMIIRRVDQLWQEHLLAMDHLRSDVHIRVVGQKDPLMEFKHEAFRLFDEFSQTLRTEIAQALFRFEIVAYPQEQMKEILNQLQMETNRSFLQDLETSSQNLVDTQSNYEPVSDSEDDEVLSPLSAEWKTGRNELCPCGSGKKYKKCCGLSKSVEVPPQGS